MRIDLLSVFLVLYAPLSSALQCRKTTTAKDGRTRTLQHLSSHKRSVCETPRRLSSSWFLSTTAASIFCFASMVPLPSYGTTPASILNHDYADPFHPFCNRKIEVSKDGKSFHYSGTAVGPKGDEVLRGCSREEIKLYKLRKGSFDGLVLDDGYRISAGDGIHEGVWEPKNTATTNLGYEDVDGIRWDDGNKWVIKSQSYVKSTADGNVVVKKPTSVAVGEVIFLSYIGFSVLAGVYGLFRGIQKRQMEQM